jgi:hypothetical protein
MLYRSSLPPSLPSYPLYKEIEQREREEGGGEGGREGGREEGGRTCLGYV